MPTEEVTMDKVVQDHERRIVILEKNVEEMKNGMLKIENTILAEGREQRGMLNQMIQYSFEDKQHKRDNNTKLSQIKWTILSGAISSSGVVFLIVQWIVNHY